MAADRLGRAKQVDERGKVMNGEKEPGSAFHFALSPEFGKSADLVCSRERHTSIQRKRPEGPERKRCELEGLSGRWTTVSEKDGRFRLWGLQPGRYHRIHARGFGSDHPTARTKMNNNYKQQWRFRVVLSFLLFITPAAAAQVDPQALIARMVENELKSQKRPF
jgi:hypothetical protein